MQLVVKIFNRQRVGKRQCLICENKNCVIGKNSRCSHQNYSVQEKSSFHQIQLQTSLKLF